MSIAEGIRLGAYEVNGQIGAGGMGEVFRATDTRLGREVAIKTLPVALASDKDRLARFEREAKLLAALNHAHIASVYSLDEHDGTLYLAMELVEGETLEEKLKPGALQVEDALRLALQIAEALEAAHSKGVVHRDLKPANVMVTADGIVKVLDFGLAKVFMDDPNGPGPVHSPALSVAMTQQGLVLGTAGYMSPEQASGQATDQRADVWAFGVLVFEMLTGMPLFSGESVPHILADVLKSKPDWSRLPKNLHPRLRLMLERCLEKKPRDRYHSIADARVDIEKVLSDPHGLDAPAVETGISHARPTGIRVALATGFVLAGAAMAALVLLRLWPSPPVLPVSRFSHVIQEGQPLGAYSRVMLAVSRDGRQVVYNTANGLYLRRLDDLEATPIEGSEAGITDPFFSRDGLSLGFWSIERNAIERLSVAGGAAIFVTDAEGGRLFGADWQADGTIIYALESGIYSVETSRGTPRPLIQAEAEERFYAPRLLPDGDSLLFSIANATDWDTGRIVVQSLSSGERSELIQGGSDARYVPTGHIVFTSEGRLYGVPFDMETLTVSGDTVVLEQGLLRAGLIAAGNSVPNAGYDISDNGTLVYMTGPNSSAARTIVWVDRDGEEEQIDLLPMRNYQYVQLSPDGRRLALDVRDDESGEANIWLFDLEGGQSRQFTFDDGMNRGPLWIDDPERIVFTRGIGNTEEVYWQLADQSQPPEPLTANSGRLVFANDITPDGFLLYMDVVSPRDISMLPIGDPGAEPVQLIATPANELGAHVSPNGLRLAYQSDRTGANEIYMQPYPVGPFTQVSSGGGTRPRWSRSGRELIYYVEPTTENRAALMSIAIDWEPEFKYGQPTVIFEGDYVTPNASRQSYDIDLNDERFLMIKNVADEQQSEIVVVENWFEELKRRVPLK